MPLGRGLGSLIPQKVNKTYSDDITPAMSVVSDEDKILHIAPDAIKPNSQQPRSDFNEANLEDLARSIKEYGILQPLVVSRRGEGYELIAGERRLRAAKIAGLKTVPVIVRLADEQKRLEMALIENIQREDLNPIELAMSYRRLADEFNLKTEEVAKRLGKSRPLVSNIMRLLGLPAEMQKALAEGLISPGHGNALLGLDSEAKQFELFRKIVANKMTVAQVAEETKKMGGTKQARIKDNSIDQDRVNKLQEFFGSRSKIHRKNKGGQIIIDFADDETLNEIIKKIS
jgi:ParB family chromosome partitioning protein